MHNCRQTKENINIKHPLNSLRWFTVIPKICCRLWNKDFLQNTYMPHIPTFVCQAHGQDQQEKGDNYSYEENHIHLDQASQRPVKTIQICQQISNSSNRKLLNHVIVSKAYTYNTNMIPVFKPVPYLDTSAKNKLTYSLSTEYTKAISKIMISTK